MTKSPDDTVQVRTDPVRHLTAFGFEPDLPVYELDYTSGQELKPGDVTVATLKRALFDSTYSHPIVLPLVLNSEPDAFDLPMVVELAHAVYIPAGTIQTTVGCCEHPDWYVRGYLYKSPFDTSTETTRMHAFLSADSRTGVFEMAIVQLVHHSTRTASQAPVLPDAQTLDSL